MAANEAGLLIGHASTRANAAVVPAPEAWSTVNFEKVERRPATPRRWNKCGDAISLRSEGQLQGQLHLARTAVTERIAVGDVGRAGDRPKAGAVDCDVG